MAKLDREIHKFHEEEASNPEPGDATSSERLEDNGDLDEHGRLGPDPGSQETPCPPDAPPAAADSTRASGQPGEKGDDKADGCPQGRQGDNLDEARDKVKDGEVITVG